MASSHFASSVAPDMVLQKYVRELDKCMADAQQKETEYFQKNCSSRELADLVLQSAYIEMYKLGSLDSKSSHLKNYQTIWKESVSARFPKRMTIVDDRAMILDILTISRLEIDLRQERGQHLASLTWLLMYTSATEGK